MFDLGMWELMLVGVVALLVLGPDKLPKAARTAGYWVRRARQSWYAVRSEIERELAADEFKRSIHDTREAMGESAQKVRESSDHIQRSITGHVPGLEPPTETTATGTADPEDAVDSNSSATPDTPDSSGKPAS